MLKELTVNQAQNNNKVKGIKFISTYSIPEQDVAFERNGLWEFKDKYESFDFELGYIWIYRIEFEDEIFLIPSTEVVELEVRDLKNKDYTKQQWDKKITTDGYVDEISKDGDYVQTAKILYGINEPVKKIADQADYDKDWIATQKRMERFFRQRKSGNGTSGLS